MARDDEDDAAPASPASPKNPFARAMQGRTRQSTPGLDRPIAGAEDAMTPRELSADTRGPLKSVSDTNDQFTKDITSRWENKRYSRNYAKKPLTLTGGKR